LLFPSPRFPLIFSLEEERRTNIKDAVKAFGVEPGMSDFKIKG